MAGFSVAQFAKCRTLLKGYSEWVTVLWDDVTSRGLIVDKRDGGLMLALPMAAASADILIQATTEEDEIHGPHIIIEVAQQFQWWKEARSSSC